MAAWHHPTRVPPGTVIASVVVLGAGLHGAGVRGLLRVDKRDRPDAGHGHHLRQPGRGGRPRGRCRSGSSSQLGTGLGFVLILAGSWLSTAPRGRPRRGSSAALRGAGDPAGDPACVRLVRCVVVTSRNVVVRPASRRRRLGGHDIVLGVAVVGVLRGRRRPAAAPGLAGADEVRGPPRAAGPRRPEPRLAGRGRAEIAAFAL